jgi:dihydroorotate dehydrogenase electron transfer subunit
VFSADAETGECSVLFSVHGLTSRAMARHKAGDLLDIVGPLGGRVFEADPRPGAWHVMVGGGYGVPPLAFLARRVLADASNAHVTFIDGARSREFLVGTDGLDDLGARLRPCTEDGSHGICGRVTDVLETVLDEAHAARRRTGPRVHVRPTPMMRAVAALCEARNVPCQVSLEVFMPCGLGICMGCAVKRPDGTYARGCYDGPVFEAREVVWE